MTNENIHVPVICTKLKKIAKLAAMNLISYSLFSSSSLIFLLVHTRLTALFPGLPGWAGTKKAKPNWILLKQETVSGSGISWAICKSAPRSRQITCQHLTTPFFTGRMPFLPPNQQRQSTEGNFFKFFISAVNKKSAVKIINYS